MTKYKQTHTAFAKSLNKILEEQLFRVQVAQELNDPEPVSLTWVKHRTPERLNALTTRKLA